MGGVAVGINRSGCTLFSGNPKHFYRSFDACGAGSSDVDVYLYFDNDSDISLRKVFWNKNQSPTLLVVACVAALRGSRIVIDWHNLGFTVLAERMGENHFVVKLAKYYENIFSRRGLWNLEAFLTWLSSRAGCLRSPEEEPPSLD